MAAYAAVVSLMNNIEQIIAHPRLSNCFVEEQMESILQKAGSLLGLIEGGYNHEDLEREITSAAHSAEDAVESHVVYQIHAGTLRSLDLQQVIQDMGAVAGKAMEVIKEKEGAREEEEQPPTTHPTPPVESGGVTAMVGLDDELIQLLDMLTDHNPKRHVISIVGMGGTGKTTLAQNLYSHQVVKERFDLRGWATISQHYSSQELLSQLISCIGKSNNAGGLGDQIHTTLYGKRYLIVLDDIWGVEAWDRVRRYLPDGGNSSRVILTTRLTKVASDCGSTCFDMNLLDEGRSWKLFCHKAHFEHNYLSYPPNGVAKRIVRACKGLALSIVVIGGILRNASGNVWYNILEGLETSDSIEKQQGLDALSLSFNHLPPHLKPCFLYLGVFKEDARIHVSKVTKLWVSEGFIKPNGTRILEEIAEDYIEDMRDRNLVLDVERSYNGKIKSFSIHDLLRDLCIKVGEQQGFFHTRKSGDQVQGTERRIVVCRPSNKKELRSAVSARTVLQSPADHWEYNRCKLLRVLENAVILDDYNRPATEVYGNVNLRYFSPKLHYGANGRIELPSSTYLVWNLQTIVVEYTQSPPRSGDLTVIVAPPNFWEMRQLRHFKCDHASLPVPWNRQARMENLHTLWVVVNFRVSEEVCEMIPNIKKLGLVYYPTEQGYDESMIDYLHNLDCFRKLESLSLRFALRDWPPLDFQVHSKLAFPPSLTKLCLSNCKLSWEGVSMAIGPLPRLQVLRLGIHAVDGWDCWSPLDGHFGSLKLLEISFCRLTSWDAESSHFPKLEKLLLKYVYGLKEIPLDIGEISTLGLIRVDQCSESAAISAVRIKKDQLENQDNEELQIEVSVSDLESLKKRLEEEELPLNLFKLQTR